MQRGGANFQYDLKPAKRADTLRMLKFSSFWCTVWSGSRMCESEMQIFVPRPRRTVQAASCILVPSCVCLVWTLLPPQSPPPTWTARTSPRASGWCRRLTCGKAVRPAARTRASYGCFWRRYRAVSRTSPQPPRPQAPPRPPVSADPASPRPVCWLGPLPRVTRSLACTRLTCCAQLVLNLAKASKTQSVLLGCVEGRDFESRFV